VQCGPGDGGCVNGVCTFSGCAVPDGASVKCITSLVGSPPGCQAMDAIAVGDCNTLLDWSWNGSKCIPLVGCACQGRDCYNNLDDLFTCNTVFLGCPHNSD
jgi:hypothetical protein